MFPWLKLLAGLTFLVLLIRFLLVFVVVGVVLHVALGVAVVGVGLHEAGVSARTKTTTSALRKRYKRN
jgi:hypothetical protein